MTKAICILLFLLPVSLLHAQSDFFVLKKGQRTIRRFHEKDPIIFQHKNGDWFTGDITSIANDSFVFRQEIIYYYMMGTDTVHLGGMHFSIHDIKAFPKPGIRFHYVNNTLEVNRGAGHVHWYWVKSGWLFRTGALGYVGLRTANGLIDHDLSFNTAQAVIPAGLFLAGVLMHRKWKFYLPVDKKYHIEYLRMTKPSSEHSAP